MVVGEQGLLLVRYVGPHNGVIKGSCTGHKYVVRKTDREPQYVDMRDIPGLMKMRDGDNQLMFVKGGNHG